MDFVKRVATSGDDETELQEPSSSDFSDTSAENFSSDINDLDTFGDFDTLADRVRSHGGGWVLKNNKSYYDQILELTSDAASIQEEKICVLKCQNSMTNAGQMSKMYYERYFAI